MPLYQMQKSHKQRFEEAHAHLLTNRKTAGLGLLLLLRMEDNLDPFLRAMSCLCILKYADMSNPPPGIEAWDDILIRVHGEYRMMVASMEQIEGSDDKKLQILQAKYEAIALKIASDKAQMARAEEQDEVPWEGFDDPPNYDPNSDGEEEASEDELGEAETNEREATETDRNKDEGIMEEDIKETTIKETTTKVEVYEEEVSDEVLNAREKVDETDL